MGSGLTSLDIGIFVVSLAAVMIIGLVAGRRETTAEDYFLAGRRIGWWGVAASVFGSNVSANHLVGMMGIGFTVGFAQSHFELGAIAGLMLLCYGFLPVYRKLNLFTLSDYLRRRYDDRSALLYAIFMVVVMVLVQMVGGLYIGSRSLNILLAPTGTSEVSNLTGTAHVEPSRLDRTDDAASGAHLSQEVHQPEVSERTGISEPNGDAKNGRSQVRRPEIGFGYYALGVIVLTLIAGTYTIFGGLKAVVWTDMIQTVLILIAGIGVGLLVFSQPEIQGWSGMRAIDQTAHEVQLGTAGLDSTHVVGGEKKMRLYLPSHHGDLPWTGVLSGLMVLHFFYWGTNQFIVQRALGAASDEVARAGIVVAGFLKLLIPFFAIGSGIAAYYLFQQRMPGVQIDSDAAFTEVVKLVVHPGWGIMGLIATGLIGAILSSIDSMMNSSATIVTFDIFQRYFRPQASQRQLIWVGRVSIAGFVVVAGLVAIFLLDPNSEQHFFLQIIDQQSYLAPGLVVAFFLGVFWKRANATGAFVTILAGPLFAIALNGLYATFVAGLPAAQHAAGVSPHSLIQWFGDDLNTFHRVMVNVVFCVAVQVVVSLLTKGDEEKSKLTWTELGGHDPADLRRVVGSILGAVALLGLLAWAMVDLGLKPVYAAALGSAVTFALATCFASTSASRRTNHGERSPGRSSLTALLTEDRFWAGVLCSFAVFMLFYFYH